MKYYNLKKEAKKKRKYQYEVAEVETFEVELPDINMNSFSGSVYRYISLQDKSLTIHKGYIWDGSTVPLKKWYRWIWDSDKYCKIASLFHDSCYQLMRVGVLPILHKDYIDKHYKELCIKGGMGKRQAGLRLWALSNFSKIKVQKEKISGRKILEV